MKRIIALLTSLFLIQACDSNSVSQQDIDNLVKKTLDNMVFVKGGSFMMGDAGGEYIDENGNKRVREYWTGSDDNKPAHKVTLDSYYMGKFEVTYAEHDVYSGAVNKEIVRIKAVGQINREPQIPVYLVNWFVANDYCAWLAKVSGKPFDLATEAQWEYAARSRGDNVLFATDNGKIEFGRNVRGADHFSFAGAAGSFPPNPIGISAMTSSSAEWVKDWYDSGFYSKSPKQNPQGPLTGDEKILRGGGTIGIGSISVFARKDTPPEHIQNGGSAGGIRCVVNSTSPLT